MRAEEGSGPRSGARRSLQPLSGATSPLEVLLTFSLRMERITFTTLALYSGTLQGTGRRERFGKRNERLGSFHV